MPYVWSSQQEIQSYLDIKGTITIGDVNADAGNFPDTTAELLENDAVFDISILLSVSWCMPLPVNNTDLQRLVAKLTSARIIDLRVGSTIGGIPDASQRWKNEVFATCQRLALNYKTMPLTDATPRDDVKLADILIYFKLRDQMVSDDN